MSLQKALQDYVHSYIGLQSIEKEISDQTKKASGMADAFHAFDIISIEDATPIFDAFQRVEEIERRKQRLQATLDEAKEFLLIQMKPFNGKAISIPHNNNGKAFVRLIAQELVMTL